MENNLYIRRDCDNGVLTNIEDITYYKATQDVEIISNYLLGNFNQDGEYIINEEIIEELVEMPKGVTNEFSNMFFCVSKVVTEYVELEKFVVKTRYDEDDPSIKISTLEVLEDVKKVDGYFVNTLSTPIAEFVDVASENYKEKMFDAFNIIDKDQLSSSQIDKFAYGKVSLRRKYIASIQKICEPQLQEVHKQAYLKKLEILKNSGKVGENTLKLFEDRLKNKPIIATNNNFKALNELLDSVIEVHKEELKPVLPQIRQVGIEFSEKVEQTQKLSFQNLKNMQSTPVAIKAIQTQQDAIFNNKIAKNQPIKQIITQEVKEADFAKKESKYNIVNKQEDISITQGVKQEPKKERVNILKSLFGIGNKDVKKENKEPKKEIKEVKNSNIKDNRNTNVKETKNNIKDNKTNTILDNKADKINTSTNVKTIVNNSEKYENTAIDNTKTSKISNKAEVKAEKNAEIKTSSNQQKNNINNINSERTDYAEILTREINKNKEDVINSKVEKNKEDNSKISIDNASETSTDKIKGKSNYNLENNKKDFIQSKKQNTFNEKEDSGTKIENEEELNKPFILNNLELFKEQSSEVAKAIEQNSETENNIEELSNFDTNELSAIANIIKQNNKENINLKNSEQEKERE